MEQTPAFSTGLAHLRAQLGGANIRERGDGGEMMGVTHKSPSPTDSRPTHLCFQFSQLSPTIVTQKAVLLQREAKEQERIMGW